MKDLRNPKWILIINTIPVILLYMLFIGEYNIIKSSLDIEHIRVWRMYGAALALITSFNLIYAIKSIVHQKKLTSIYGILTLVTHIILVVRYFFDSDDFIPSSFPRWMVSDELPMYVGTFLMPTMAYSLFVIISCLTPEDKEYKAWKNFLAAMAIPLSWYLFNQTIFPLWNVIDTQYGYYVLVIFIIASTIGFEFLIFRGIIVTSRKMLTTSSRYTLLWKIPLCLILPLGQWIFTLFT